MILAALLMALVPPQASISSGASSAPLSPQPDVFERSLFPGRLWPIQGEVVDVEVADLDQDGRGDLVALVRYPHSVVVFRQDSGLQFEQSFEIALSGFPADFEVADFTGDGLPDVAVANFTPAIEFFTGQGDGTLVADQTTALGNLGDLHSGDLNADGAIDLVVADWPQLAVRLLLSSPGGFVEQLLDWSSTPEWIYVADVDGDGANDVAALTADNRLVVRRGDPSSLGSFLAEQSSDVPPMSEGLTLQDANGDGLLDALIRTYFYQQASDSAGFLPGQGDGTFGSATLFPTVEDPRTVWSGDFDGDGQLEVLASSRGAEYSAAPGFSLAPVVGSSSFGPVTTVTGLGNAFVRHVADFNQDGRDDLVITVDGLFSLVGVVRTRDDGSFGPQQHGSIDFAPNDFVAGDLDGDGQPDLAVLDFSYSSGSSVTSFRGASDGSFTEIATSTVAATPMLAEKADIDADGLMDVAIASSYYSGDVDVLRSVGDGTFTSTAAFSVGATSTGLAFEDLNGDGLFDVLTTSLVDIGVSLASAPGVFDPPLLTSAGTALFHPRVDDLNADGLPDVIAVQRQTNDLVVAYGSPGGGFGTPQRVPTLSWPEQAVFADFDQDGRKDVAVIGHEFWLTPAVARLGVHFTTPNGAIGPLTYPLEAFAGAQVFELEAADINADGYIDLAWTDRDSSALVLTLGRANGRFGPLHHYLLGGPNPQAIELVEIDGDGRLDVVQISNGGALQPPVGGYSVLLSRP